MKAEAHCNYHSRNAAKYSITFHVDDLVLAQSDSKDSGLDYYSGNTRVNNKALSDFPSLLLEYNNGHNWLFYLKENCTSSPGCITAKIFLFQCTEGVALSRRNCLLF